MKNKNKPKKISSHMEDYLEAIAFLKKEKGTARVNDIGKLLHVKNSSVNAALATLSKDKLVLHEKYGDVELTPEGAYSAKSVQRRHDVMFKFLTKVLKIDQKTAQEDACKMEHAISQATLERLVAFIEKVESCPGFIKQERNVLKKAE